MKKMADILDRKIKTANIKGKQNMRD